MGALQIDTIHVVARSPYLVLWSRLGAYPLTWLDELLAEQALFEYWSHAACLLPIEHYPLYRTLERRRSSRQLQLGNRPRR
ncbi:MAG: crosslink repair DNA glycosylase YcaQ family protein [Dehalococcoidia bacterium]